MNERRRLPAAFVVTVSAVASAPVSGCHAEEPVHANPAPQEPIRNPPPPPPPR